MAESHSSKVAFIISGRFSAHEHLLESDGTTFDLALPWHDYVGCDVSHRASGAF